MFYFSQVLVTGLCSIEESSLNCTRILYEIFVHMLYFNNFFLKKVNGHFSRSSKTNQHEKQNPHFHILLGKIKILEVYLFCKILIK